MMAMIIPNSSPQLTALQSGSETHGSASSQSAGKSGSSFMTLLEKLGSSSAKATDGNVSAESNSKNVNATVEKNSSQKTDDAHAAEKESAKKDEAKQVDKKRDEKKTEKSDHSSDSEAAAAAQKSASTAKENAQKTEAEKNANTVHSADGKIAKNTANKTGATTDEILAQQQLAFLQTRDDSSDFDTLIANAKEYTSKKSKSDLLKDAQTLSLEDPKQFLDLAGVTGENQSASILNAKGLKKIASVADEKNTSVKGASKKDSKFSDTFTVVDERGLASKQLAAKEQKEKVKAVGSEKNNTVDMTLTLTKNVEQNILSTNNQAAGASGSNFQAMLNQQVEQNVPEFVKAGNIVLRDNKSGSINMVLKPESLGNIKINLELSDKVITGQIVVQSQEAYDAMKENIDSLKQAFEKSGFEQANFNLSFANNGTGNGSFSQNQSQQQPATEWLSNRTYGDFASSSATVASSAEPAAVNKSGSNFTIDYVA